MRLEVVNPTSPFQWDQSDARRVIGECVWSTGLGPVLAFKLFTVTGARTRDYDRAVSFEGQVVAGRLEGALVRGPVVALEPLSLH